VDDIIIIGGDNNEIQHLKEHILCHYETKKFGHLIETLSLD